MEFIAPILKRDLISVYGRVERIGRTSIAIRLDVIASRDLDEKQVCVTSGLFTYVALDKEHKPRTIPEESKAKYVE
jgi:acyl-CoA thioesterase YciA